MLWSCRILADVADVENDGLLAEVLPPVRGAVHLGAGSRRPCARSEPRSCWRIRRSRPAARRSAPGRSSWLCQGTMPPGSIVSLRKRSSRSSMWAGCLPRSIEPSVTSVTPTGLIVDHRAHVGLHLVGGAFAGDGARRHGNRSAIRRRERGSAAGRAHSDCLNMSCLLCLNRIAD